MISRRSIFGLALAPLAPGGVMPDKTYTGQWLPQIRRHFQELPPPYRPPAMGGYFDRALKFSLEQCERARRLADETELREKFAADDEGFRIALQAYDEAKNSGGTP